MASRRCVAKLYLAENKSCTSLQPGMQCEDNVENIQYLEQVSEEHLAHDTLRIDFAKQAGKNSFYLRRSIDFEMPTLPR